jgi:3-oxoacyl-[acyl-carrier-protein] synthase II
MKKRVVVTGLGMISPLGSNLATSWKRLINSESGIGELTHFDSSLSSSKVAGQVPGPERDGGFNPETYIKPRELRQMDKFMQLGVCAAEQALEDSGILEPQAWSYNAEKIGVIMGSGLSGLKTTEEGVLKASGYDKSRMSPLFIPSILGNLLPAHIAIRHGFEGINYSLNTACASGANAIGEAFEAIKAGRCEAAVCGGSEAMITPTGVSGFSACRVLSTSYNHAPQKASRPWDKHRDGFVIGEGSGVLFLEDYENAKKRGANIYAELTGFGTNSDAYHITGMQPDGLGAQKAVNFALEQAGLSSEDIDYINAHATSTKAGDPIELAAMEQIFGGNSSVPYMSSTKSATGHLQGASGACEAIFSIMALAGNIAPATLNLEEMEYKTIIDLVPGRAKEREMTNVLSNSFGFGGSNASLIFSKLK